MSRIYGDDRPTKQEQINSLNENITTHVKSGIASRLRILELESIIEDLENKIKELKTL